MNKNKSDEIDRSLKLLVKSSSIVFLGLVFSKVFTYFYRIIIARHYGPETYGLFSLAIMILGWVIAIFSFGLMEGVVKFIPAYNKEPDKARYIFRQSTHLLALSGIVAAVLLFLFSEFISVNIFKEEGLIIFLKTFSFLIPVWIFTNFLLSFLRAYEHIGWYSFILNFIQNSVKLVTIAIFVLIGMGQNAIISSYFIAFILMLFLSIFILNLREKSIFKKSNSREKYKKLKRDLFTYSWPMMFAGVVASIFYWIDTFAIGYFMGPYHVGIYNAAVPIALLLVFIPELFIQLFLPLINREYSRNNLGIVKELSKQLGKWILFLNIPLFIIIFAFPGVILNLLFGSEYLLAEIPLKILSLGFFISSAFHLSQNLILMRGKTKIILYDLILTSCLNIILNFLLVPKYGLVGAAISTTISWLVLSILWIIQSYRLTRIFPLRKKIIGILLSGVISTLVVFIIKKFVEVNIISVLLVGFLFLFLYLILVLVTNSLDKNDLMILRSIKKKIF